MTQAFIKHALLTLATGAMAACASTGELSSPAVTGTASYLERIALPPNAVFEATLEDVSRADAPAVVLGRTKIDPAGHPPYRFSIAYDAAQIDERFTYAVRARISVEGKLIFTTDTTSPVITRGKPSNVDLLLKKIGSPAAAPSPSFSTVPNASLSNTYWKLMLLAGKPVSVVEHQREPSMLLRAGDQPSVSGQSGCNRFTGAYTLNESALSFGKMASTMMACIAGSETERDFMQALSKVARWSIEGNTLRLQDAAGANLMVFEARVM